MIDPVLLSFGPIEIRWYGVTYLLAFGMAWILGNYRAKHSDAWNQEQVTDLIFFSAWGVILGGRIGYELFYNLETLLRDPFDLFRVWQGGMSFHGGLIGVLVSLLFYKRKHRKSFLEVSDFLAPLVPLGIAFVRFGNFINGELWGRETDVSWGMVFPMGGDVIRHPSQLYEAFFEGIILFLMLWVFSRKPRKSGQVSAGFLVGYSLFRFFVEFYREPDAHIGFVAFDWLTQGQLLSLGMLIGGFVLWIFTWKKPQ